MSPARQYVVTRVMGLLNLKGFNADWIDSTWVNQLHLPHRAIGNTVEFYINSLSIRQLYQMAVKLERIGDE